MSGKLSTFILLSILFIINCNTKDVFFYVQEVYDPDKGMIYIPAGEFSMGSNNGNIGESPVHVVYLDAYYIDENPVTNKEYSEFLKSSSTINYDYIPKNFTNESWEFRLEIKPRHPVVGISYNAARTYASWKGKVLPTEAQWEKAARGNT